MLKYSHEMLRSLWGGWRTPQTLQGRQVWSVRVFSSRKFFFSWTYHLIGFTYGNKINIVNESYRPISWRNAAHGSADNGSAPESDESSISDSRPSIDDSVTKSFSSEQAAESSSLPVSLAMYSESVTSSSKCEFKKEVSGSGVEASGCGVECLSSISASSFLVVAASLSWLLSLPSLSLGGAFLLVMIKRGGIEKKNASFHHHYLHDHLLRPYFLELYHFSCGHPFLF